MKLSWLAIGKFEKDTLISAWAKLLILVRDVGSLRVEWEQLGVYHHLDFVDQNLVLLYVALFWIMFSVS